MDSNNPSSITDKLMEMINSKTTNRYEVVAIKMHKREYPNKFPGVMFIEFDLFVEYPGRHVYKITVCISCPEIHERSDDITFVANYVSTGKGKTESVPLSTVNFVSILGTHVLNNTKFKKINIFSKLCKNLKKLNFFTKEGFIETYNKLGSD